MAQYSLFLLKNTQRVARLRMALARPNAVQQSPGRMPRKNTLFSRGQSGILAETSTGDSPNKNTNSLVLDQACRLPGQPVIKKVQLPYCLRELAQHQK